MRYVLKLVVLAAFAAGVSLTVGCGEGTATPDAKPAETKPEAKPADDGSSTSAVAPKGVEGQVSTVSFDVTGMT